MTYSLAGQTITAPDASGHGLDISNGQDWLPGVCRGLVATAGGQVRAENCHATRWWIRLEGHRGPRMSRNQAQALMARLEGML